MPYLGSREAMSGQKISRRILPPSPRPSFPPIGFIIFREDRNEGVGRKNPFIKPSHRSGKYSDDDASGPTFQRRLPRFVVRVYFLPLGKFLRLSPRYLNWQRRKEESSVILAREAPACPRALRLFLPPWISQARKIKGEDLLC